ncbi:alpha/beta-hydrolase [Myriangium duriaei CBS 260.36]|uniref:Alpha/beta-hydrolase n=1 Tax=Myriangium duriaei CBS 260.36 TaxID=1168546 RepID=A0A9P4J1G8_9PEZI|nr:alpha/beta-hydrolase [Myriangium duriaei CBS 260.36]
MEIQTRSDRSFLTLALQASLRPLKPRLATPEKTYPAGSNKLHPHEHLHKKVFRYIHVQERKQDGIYVYDMSPKSGLPTAACRRRMYYFAGGGWQQRPSMQHWRFCAELVRKIPGLIISVVSPPLAPESPAAEALPQLNTFYSSVLQQGEQAGERTIFGGDSSGGNIVLSLALQGLTKNDSGVNPDALLIISPAVDLRPMKVEGPIVRASKMDPVLTVKGHNGEADVWCQQSDRSDASLSPITGDMGLLANAGIKVIGMTGGYDILTPDALKLRDKCQQSKVQGAWLQWEKQMHCLPLTFMYHLPEGVKSKDWVVEQLERI